LQSKNDKEEYGRFFKAALKVAKKLKLNIRGMPEGFVPTQHQIDQRSWTCFDYNDDARNTPEQLAEWFEETVKKLGYDVK